MRRSVWPTEALIQRSGARLEQIVHRALVEGGDGVLVVGRDEDDVGAAVDLAGHVDAGGPGHLDVEEEDVGPVLVQQAQRLQAVGSLADDAELGPEPAELLDQFAAQCGLVLGDDGGG